MRVIDLHLSHDKLLAWVTHTASMFNSEPCSKD